LEHSGFDHLHLFRAADFIFRVLAFRLYVFAHLTQGLGRLIEQRIKILLDLFIGDVRKIDARPFRFGD
jgi:hypothetical protein